MKPTSIRLLIILAVIGATGGWALAVVVAGWTGRSLPLPVLAGAALWLLAIGLATWGTFVRPRIRARQHPSAQATAIPMPALQAARVAVLTMAAARMGAIVAGIYAGIAVATLAEGLTTPAAEQAMWSALLATSGAAVTSGVSLWIERACVLSVGEDDDE